MDPCSFEMDALKLPAAIDISIKNMVNPLENIESISISLRAASFSIKMKFITDKTVSYATRASSTWVNTQDGWKILHTSYAPRKGKNGLPEMN